MKNITLNDLELALKAGEFTFYYQPKIDLQDGNLVGAEALVRWVRPDGTFILPGEFIPLAEKTGFISEITTILLGDIVQHIQPLISVRPELTVSFNVSSTDLKTPYLASMLSGYISERRISPGHIEIELTESTLVRNKKRAQKSLAGLRALGVSLALDDFGAGYSSFDVLCDYPFTIIKIDRRLINNVLSCPRYQAVVRSVTGLAAEFGIKVVAEGIETPEQLNMARKLGCHHGQGYYIARPMSLQAYHHLLANDRKFGEALGIKYAA